MEKLRVTEGTMPSNSYEDTLLRLPIRLGSTIANHTSNEVMTHQNGVLDERRYEFRDDSDSDLSQAILTPEATSSDEDDTEIFRTLDHISSQSNAEHIETLHEAIREGDIDLVKDKLKTLNIEHEASDSCTSLIRAIKHVQLDTMHYLLERGADVHHRVKGLPPIVYAVLNGTPQFIQLLMNYGADPTSTSNTEEYNTLHFAVMHEKIDAAGFLISKGVDLEEVCLGGRTALLLAAEKGQTVIAKLLLAKGAEIHHTCSMGQTALAYAARNNHLETVRYLLKQGLDIEDSDDTGISALSAASNLGLTDMVQLLLENGANVNSVSLVPQATTPVMNAATAGHTQVVRLLIDHGANVAVRNSNGETVIDATMSAGHRDTVHVLLTALGGIDYPLTGTALEIAMSNSTELTMSLMLDTGIMDPTADREDQSAIRHDYITWLFEQGGDLLKPRALLNMMYAALDAEDVAVVDSLSNFSQEERGKYLPCGNTPLTFAVTRRNVALVQKLLDCGHDTSKTSRRPEGENHTPLVQALVALDEDWERDTSIVDALLNSGKCKLMAGDTFRSTAFDYLLSHYSRWTHGVAEVMMFRMLNSIQNIQDDRSEDGSTLLHAAVWYNRQDLIGGLVDRGADINAKDKQGCTPFLLACGASTKLLCDMLSHGADAHARDVDGQGALHAAAATGDVDIINTVLACKWAIDAVDNNGYTPFAWAIISGQEDPALYLLARGASIPTRTFRRGRNLLHTAASLAMSRLVPVLLHQVHWDINAQDDMGFTPLALACRKGTFELVNKIVDAGADVSISNNAGDRPLDIAIKAGNDPSDGSIVELLVQCGAEDSRPGMDRGSSTLAHLAERGCTNGMRMLLDHQSLAM